MTGDGEYAPASSARPISRPRCGIRNIVAVHDRGEFDGQLWIAMDYVDGTDAAELLRSYPHGLPQRDVPEIVTGVAEALDYAHQRHLLHRDVKPANILLARLESGEQRILLADFGIARWEDDASGLTQTNMTVGTVSLRRAGTADGPRHGRPRRPVRAGRDGLSPADGAPPFQHSNPAVVISQHLTAQPPSLAARRPELANLDPALRRALSKGARGPLRALRGLRQRARPAHLDAVLGRFGTDERHCADADRRRRAARRRTDRLGRGRRGCGRGAAAGSARRAAHRRDRLRRRPVPGEHVEAQDLRDTTTRASGSVAPPVIPAP